MAIPHKWPRTRLHKLEGVFLLHRHWNRSAVALTGVLQITAPSRGLLTVDKALELVEAFDEDKVLGLVVVMLVYRDSHRSFGFTHVNLDANPTKPPLCRARCCLFCILPIPPLQVATTLDLFALHLEDSGAENTVEGDTDFEVSSVAVGAVACEKTIVRSDTNGDEELDGDSGTNGDEELNGEVVRADGWGALFLSLSFSLSLFSLSCYLLWCIFYHPGAE